MSTVLPLNRTMSISPPPTPPSHHPARGTYRFKPVIGAFEWEESYHPGSYHPVDVGDILRDGQYRVVRKLGYGSFSTVWLAHDCTNDTYVALKIVMANLSAKVDELPEVALYRQVAQKAADQGQSRVMDQHITRLLDTFDLHGPNGVHKCVVFEPMGPTVNSMAEALPQFATRTRFTKVRYPVWMAKQILRGTLEALQLLHQHGIAHGDVQPGNILFPLREGLTGQSERALWQPDNEDPEYPTSISAPVERVDGKVDRWAPKRLYVPMPLAEFADYSPGFRVKISDLGGAYHITKPPEAIVTPTGLRAPELIFKPSTVLDGRTLDVWSMGCLVFEIVTGRPLFCVPWAENEDEIDDDHLFQLSAVLAPLPDGLFSRWKRSSLYFHSNADGSRTLYNDQIGVPDAPATGTIYGLHRSMEQMFDKAAPEVASTAEAEHIKKMIRRILQYDPAQRPTVSELLQDAWFVRDDW